MSWRGRKVTDPKPVVRAPLDEYGVKPTKGLDPVFKGMEHAKSQLRNIEHRLQEAERPANPHTSGESLNVPVDRVPSYTLNPKTTSSSILVDSLGKTHHLRSREEISSRKVSRLEDKYKDREYKDRRQRSPLREPNVNSGTTTTDRRVAWVDEGLGTAGTSTATTTTTGYKSATGSTLRGLSSLDTRALGSTSASGKTGGQDPSINFINDQDDGVLTKDGGVRGYLDLPGRWTKVDVPVPVAGSSNWGRRTDPLASTYPPKANPVVGTSRLGGEAASRNTATQEMAASGSSAASAPPNVNATYTVNGESSNSTSPNSSRFKPKKSLRDLETSSDTLAKLREKVRQQKMLASSGESQGSSENDLHVNHKTDDLVIARVPGHQAEPLVIVRKVAAGPPVPRYQGFSEAEMKYRLPDGKMVKVSDIRRRKLKKMRKEAPLKEKNTAHTQDTEEKKPPKAARVIAPPKKPTKTDSQTGDIITTRSWRVGAKLVLQELGPNKLPKMGESPPCKDKSEQQNKSDNKTPGAPLSSEARSVLRDMQSGSEDEREMDHKDQEETKKPHKRKRPKTTAPGDNVHDDQDDEKQAKVRHYDADEVKRYMARQRAERRRRQQEESARAQTARQQRESQLAELYQKQKETARLQTAAAEKSDPKSQTLTLDGPFLDRRQEDGIKPSGESDKENRGGASGAWGDLSSTESTLSGGSAPGTSHADAIKQAAADAEYFIKKYATRSPELNDILNKYTASGRRSRHDMDVSEDGASAKPSSSFQAREVDSLINKYTTTGGSRPGQPSGSAAAAGAAAPGLRSADSGLGGTATDLTRYLADTGIQVDQVVSRFSGRAANIGSSYGAPSRAPLGMGGASSLPAYLREPSAMTLPNQPFSATALTGANANTRADRIRALCENASLLGQRLSSERQRISGLAQTQPASDRWAVPRDDLDDQPYITRYDRMTGGRDNYNVFGTGIPGTSGLSKHLAKSREEEAATKIQAAYRGHSVRQDLSPERSYQHMKSDDGLSDISDSTLHEDELYKPLALRKPAAGKVRLPGTAVQPAGRDGGRTRSTVAGRWEEPSADPYSVLNVLSRRKDPLARDRYKRVGLFDDSVGEEGQDGDRTLQSLSDHQLSDNLTLSDDSTFTGEAPTDKDKSAKLSRHSASHHSASQRSRSPVSVSQLSEEDSSFGDYTKSYTESRSRPLASQRSARSASGAVSHRSAQSTSRHSPTRSLQAPTLKSAEKKTSFEEREQVAIETRQDPTPKPDPETEEGEDQDDTLEGPPSPSLPSDLDDKQDDPAMSVEISDVSESSDLSVADRSAGNRRAYAPGGVAYRPGLVTGRLSPGGLERRMTAELNLLESMEESVRQLTNVDRTRGISLAQQESVSLAQILKAQEQGHKQQLATHQREAAFLTRELSGAQRTAADATERATTSIEKARQETTRSLQESTMNLIATQSEAAKATAEAARQLAEVKVAAAGAASNITNENTSRLIHETAVATATAVSTVLHDKIGKRDGALEQATQYSSRTDRAGGDSSYTSDTYESDYTRSQTTTRSQTRSKAPPGSRPDSRSSYTREVETASPGTSPAGTGSIKTGSVVTASDMSKTANSSIATESGAAAAPASVDNSKSESIMEEVMSEKIVDDYSIDFDTSVTEEEMEKSLREVLPAEVHRKRIKKTSSQSDLSSIASDEHKEALASLSTPSSRRLSFEGDSFTKFTVDMVRQYMREEEIRAQHQAALLKLRERALKEKTQAELAWLEQQKVRGRDKAADEVYPLIKKKRRGLLLRLQQEQAEIRRLKEASKAASKERQFLLMQSQEIARLRQTTQQITQQSGVGKSKVEQWLYDLDSSSLEVDSYPSSAQVKEKIKSRPAATPEGIDIPTDDELNFNLDDSDILSLSSPNKDLESTEGGDKKSDPKPLQKLRKMKLDDKFLTHREQQLLQRRLQVEGLLEWKQKLDREEAEIEAMEKAALSLAKRQKEEAKRGKDKDNKQDKKEKEKPATTPRSARADTIASELDSIKEESYSESFSISQSTQSVVRTNKRTPRSESEIPEDVPDTARTKASESSIREEVFTNGQNTASIAEEIPTSRSGKRTPDSSEEANVTSSTTHEEYTNETFESDAVTSTVAAPGPAAGSGTKKGSSAPPRLNLGGKADGNRAPGAPKSPKSPLKSPNRRGSESESEDSYSVAHSETASDQSDLENRIRALSEDLKRRKLEAERLKKEAKKQQKERLRQEEHALKKQIEAYDKYISEVKTEITDDVELQDRGTVQPQIKKPTPGQKKSPPTLTRGQKESRPRSDSDGSRSSSSIEGGDSPGQTTPLSPITPGGLEALSESKGASFADSISESLMSPQTSSLSQKKTSTPDDKSNAESRSRIIERSETIDEVPEEDSVLNNVDDPESEVQLRLDISKTDDVADTSKPAVTESQQATTARSLKSITEDVPTETMSVASRGQSRAESRDESSVAVSKSEQIKTEKSLKTQYSSDFGDDSDRSVSHKSEKSFTYSDSRTSRSQTSYSDEFTDGTTGKSSPRRKDPPSVSVSKKSKAETEKSIVEDSIQTEEEVSEQLEAESDDEGGVMLEMDAPPAPAAEARVDPLPHLNIGDRVLVGGARPGVLRFKGTVKFADGYFGGVELDKAEGTNNGSKDGIEYFTCPAKHGIFAPPEKLEPMPDNWKEEDPEQSIVESDISEATLHEEEEDAEKIAELRKDVTKPAQEQNVQITVTRDGEESMAEDASVATTVDSELERVISSAAAAVEEFGVEQLEERSQNASPVDTTVSDALSPRETPADLEKVVDNITDGILHMVVRDSMETVGEVTQKVTSKRQSAESAAPQTVPKDKASKPSDITAEDAPKASQKTESKDQAVEVATQKLLNESISQMLSIYKKKHKSGDESQESQGSEEAVKTSPSDGTVDPSQEAPEKRQADILKLDDAGFDPFPGLSDGFGAGKDDLDQLYDELGALTGDTDEWFDDDFGLGIQKRAPPPYPGTGQEKKDKSDSSERRLDLRRVTLQEPFMAVPHKADDVRSLVSRAVDVFWELRRYGESWADVQSPPDDFYQANEARAADMESVNRRAYKRLVFDLTGEILNDIYQDEETAEDEPCSWMPPRRSRQKYHRGRDPPTMRDMVEPIVEEQVLRLSGLQSRERSNTRGTKWSSRKKQDRVDSVLLQELVEEEPDWVDYNEDETTVKMQIADSIFDSLLVETASVFTRIAQRRSV